MSRFGDNEDGIPWEMWERIVERAMLSLRGQAVFADLEDALLALPAKRVIAGELVTKDGEACAVGLLVAQREARETGNSITGVLARLASNARCWCGHAPADHDDGDGECRHRLPEIQLRDRLLPERECHCVAYEERTTTDYETARAGVDAGATSSLSWHLGWLNDEEWGGLTPEGRYDALLAFVRRAQGKQAAA